MSNDPRDRLSSGEARLAVKSCNTSFIASLRAIDDNELSR